MNVIVEFINSIKIFKISKIELPFNIKLKNEKLESQLDREYSDSLNYT